MEALLIKDGIVINRVLVTSIARAETIFPEYNIVEDNDRSYSIGDSYTTE